MSNGQHIVRVYKHGTLPSHAEEVFYGPFPVKWMAQHWVDNVGHSEPNMECEILTLEEAL